MGLFGDAFSKKNESTTNNTTTNTFTDKSANAGGAGSIALAESSNLEINTLDPEVAKASLKTASDATRLSIDATSGVASQAIDTSGRLALATINTVADNQRLAYEDKQNALNQATLTNQNIAGTAERLATLAADNIAESKKDPNNATLENVAKYAAIAGAVIVLGWVIVKTNKSK